MRCEKLCDEKMYLYYVLSPATVAGGGDRELFLLLCGLHTAIGSSPDSSIAACVERRHFYYHENSVGRLVVGPVVRERQSTLMFTLAHNSTNGPRCGMVPAGPVLSLGKRN